MHQNIAFLMRSEKGIFTEFLNIIHETFLGLETAAEINVTFL